MTVSPAPDVSEKTSSLPYQDKETVKKTKGFQPRSRAAWSREAMMKPTHENMSKVAVMMRREAYTKTHIPSHLIPPGVAILWARKFIIEPGRPSGILDSTNLRDLEMQHWKRAPTDMIPELSFVDGYGNLSDSEDYIQNKEYILLWREDWIHNMQVEEVNKKTAQKHQTITHGVANQRYFAPNTQPYAVEQSTRTASDHKNFASSAASAHFLNAHLAAS